MTEKILLIDALNSIWRANFGFKSKDENKTSYVIVYNFFRNLRSTIEEFNPTKVFFCLEGNSNFRYKLLPTYKANRIVKTGSANEKMEDFHRQKDIIIELLHHLPIATVKADAFECDDVIATLVDNLKDEEVIVVSNDSDFIQLLQKGYTHLKIYNPFKKEFVIAPDYHYLTWKSLQGDKSDNIPGLVGPKTAEKLSKNIVKFAEFMDVYENKANYALNKELIELRIVSDEALQFSEYSVNYSALARRFSEMEFASILEDKYWKRFCDTFSNLK